jgi:hypothetical protein
MLLKPGISRLRRREGYNHVVMRGIGGYSHEGYNPSGDNGVASKQFIFGPSPLTRVSHSCPRLNENAICSFIVIAGVNDKQQPQLCTTF